MLPVVLLVITMTFTTLPAQLVRYEKMESQCMSANAEIKLMYVGETMPMSIINTQFERREPTTVFCDSELLLRADYTFIDWPYGAKVVITGKDNVGAQIMNLWTLFPNTEFIRVHLPESETQLIARYMMKGESLTRALSLASGEGHDAW
jgi:hypothetical protein